MCARMCVTAPAVTAIAVPVYCRLTLNIVYFIKFFTNIYYLLITPKAAAGRTQAPSTCARVLPPYPTLPYLKLSNLYSCYYLLPKITPTSPPNPLPKHSKHSFSLQNRRLPGGKFGTQHPHGAPKSVHPPPLCMQKIVQNTILFAFWSPRGHFLMPMVTHKHSFMQFLVKTRNHQFGIRKTYISYPPCTPFWIIFCKLAVQNCIANRFRC